MQTFQHVLGPIMKEVDLNDISSNQMRDTYAKEKELMGDPRIKAKIKDRFQCSMKDLGITKKYDLIYGHFSLVYLTDDDVPDFLQRCRRSLLREQGENNGLLIIKETISADH